jgi:hypothetical protein
MKMYPIARSKRQRARRSRRAPCRFYNTLYLGCVIATLAGLAVCHAALALPVRAWRRVRALRRLRVATLRRRAQRIAVVGARFTTR